MRTLVKLLTFSLASLALVMLTACDSGGGKNSRGSMNGRGRPADTNSNNGGGTATAAGQYIGGVIGEPQDTFYKSLQGFFSATADPKNYLGYVSGQENQSTGVLLAGSAKLSSGTFQTNGSMNSQISSASLNVLIKFSYLDGSNQEQLDGWVYDSFRLTRGSVSGSRISIEFQDSFGTVTLDGEHDGTWFWGDFRYANTKSWDNQNQGYSGTLGTFYFKLCDYFQCN